MPSTRVVNTTYDAMGRVSGANWGTAPRSITGIQYWANGAQKQASIGNGLTEAWTFSPTRWQARQVSVTSTTATLLNLQFDYCGTGPLVECASNNGNVIRQLSTAGLSWNHGYSYDGWNRLTGYTEGGSAMEGYGFDEFGNRWLTSRSTALPGLTGLAITSSWFNAKNRLLDPIQNTNESSYYDAAGNQIRIGAMNLTYDGEGRVAGATNTGSGVVTYDYDAADKRVRSTVSGVSTVYVYEASGELAAEYGVGSGTSGPEFLTGDHLGSVRLVTDGAGAVKQRRDYGPFGEELETASRTAILGYGTGGQRHRFTGKERDLETGLDYFGARYLASAQGRWTSPDAPFADHQLEDPQSWSLYGYVRNNPMKFIDTNGRAKVIFDGKDKTIKLFDKDGNQIGTWDAGNVVSSEVSLGRLVDGDYAFLDTKAPHTHGQEKDPNDKNPDSTKRILKDSENGPFGVYGIFRLKTFNAESDGESHSGVGLHSGRANKGCQAATLGCVRTGDAAMKKIKETAEGGDPLTVLTVQNNRTKADAQATKATSDAKASAGGDKKPSKVKKVAPNQ